jgi:hypothetical protein
MPGVMKKAPPLPIKPLSTPPMNPKRETCIAVEKFNETNILPKTVCINELLYLKDSELFHPDQLHH